MAAQGAAIIFGPLQTAYERELRALIQQKYASVKENVAILRGRGVIPDSVKIEGVYQHIRRFQVYKDLELQNTYWVFYVSVIVSIIMFTSMNFFPELINPH
ncbi:uncharacterized protein LOC116177606 [Photinus pyralis]|uniref:uncharacterized protein LOC116177606 n=1 Tax=Photinus pyralis TaxID=7054 RepID=UPI0012674EED|nr:uncharacterized protein LOC116177606 [Photinus pyralis]